jgi:hypothetical protein
VTGAALLRDGRTFARRRRRLLNSLRGDPLHHIRRSPCRELDNSAIRQLDFDH